MWPPWLSSPSRADAASTPRRRRTFSTCTSFKDVEKLLREERLEHQTLILLRQFRHNKPPKITVQPTHLVVYFTSLRVVRRTFDDCRTVRSILRSYRAPVDDRDVSMDSAFLEELQEMFGTKKVSLPRVFVGGRYLGGAEEVMQLHDCGELKKLIGAAGSGAGHCCQCQACDGHRFVLCENCYGSHKVYIDDKIGFRSCGDCNLNGLIRCPVCFPTVRSAN
uniref:Glutaredoxin domain-containing protein n=1 Tax=Kalanchoe fedtschenkoi TaxID=63787 RepID=A0A7N0ZSG2_KALFE